MKVVLIVFLVAFGIALLFGIIFLICNSIKCNRLVKNFSACNCIVYGKKGTGKDLVFQYVINKRKRPYYANLSYGGDFTPVSIKSISVEPNTFDNLLNDDVKIIPKRFSENKDFYISDGGNYLPSQYDSKLNNLYPSLPIFYSLSRHLCNSNVHINTQSLSRPWKKLREQADYYVRVAHTLDLPFFLVTRVYTYDNYDTAEKNILPMKKSIGNKYNKAELNQFNATYGDISTMLIIQLKKSIKYDTRAFHKIFFGFDSPKKTKKTKKRVDK